MYDINEFVDDLTLDIYEAERYGEITESERDAIGALFRSDAEDQSRERAGRRGECEAEGDGIRRAGDGGSTGTAV